MAVAVTRGVEFTDEYGKIWTPIHLLDIRPGDIIAYSSSGITGWPGSHRSSNYTQRVREDMSMGHLGPLPVLMRRHGTELFAFKLQESVPYDPNGEPEDDCI